MGETFMFYDNDFSDLLQASQSSMGFWDNPIDDETWNDEEIVGDDGNRPSPR